MRLGSHSLRYLGLGVTIIALGLLIGGIGRLSWWAPSGIVTISTPAQGAAPYVATGRNVLESTATVVRIRAKASGDTPVHLAVGPTNDVINWLAGRDYVLAKDFASPTEFRTETVSASGKVTSAPSSQTTPAPSATSASPAAGEASATPSPTPAISVVTQPPAADGTQVPAVPAGPQATDPLASDMWVASASGKGKAEISWQLQDGRWSVVATTDGKSPAPQLQLEWKVEPSRLPGIALTVSGALLLLAALIFLGLHEFSEWQTRLRRTESETRTLAKLRGNTLTGAGKSALDDPWNTEVTATTTTSISRRELKAMEELAKRQARAEKRQRRSGAAKAAGEKLSNASAMHFARASKIAGQASAKARRSIKNAFKKGRAQGGEESSENEG